LQGQKPDRCVFINCPFDDDFAPILQAILFCVVYLDFHPRIATERSDSGDSRLEKIKDLIQSSRYSIHDLSRCQAVHAGEYYRLNMPFELGLDYGYREYFDGGRASKKILILEEKPFRYQAAISDLAGCDIQAHSGDFEKAVRKVRNWLVSEAGAISHGASRILGAYIDFQEWHYETQLAAGFLDADIQDYPTNELLSAMETWANSGRPATA
jgi:hypothetical protein